MHGYVGADISAVVREVGTIAIKQLLNIQSRTNISTVNYISLKSKLQDVVSAIALIRPSSMRSIFVGTSSVRYSDIGGQASVIQKLKEAVEWALRHPEVFQRIELKGVPLYGPPGCSKTILARAYAGESGVNFAAVKRAEVLISRIVMHFHFFLAFEQNCWQVGESRTPNI